MSVHTLVYVVAVMVIAALVHKVFDLIAQLEDLKTNCSSQSYLDKIVNKDNVWKLTDTADNTMADQLKHIDKHMVELNDNSNGFIESSVFCNAGDMHLCQMNNLCYHGDTDEFVMFKGERSIYENIDITDGAFSVDLSSISKHNVYTTTVLNIPSKYSQHLNITWINKTTLIFKPFLPGNVMHVFHDDIIPLYHSLRLIDLNFGTSSSYNMNTEIFSLENLMENEFLELYETFTFNRILYKKDFMIQSGLVCFKEAYIGLSRTSVWYDFGFTAPQGSVEDLKAKGNHLQSAVKFVLNQLDFVQEIRDAGVDYLVLLTRKENRKILNEVELTLEIVKQVGVKVVNINFETHSLKEIIVTIRGSRGIIGMHGSMLIFSIFLKPGSILVELFPYAVNPINYTPYKTLTELPGMHIVYKTWTNENTKNTVGHPDWPEEVGGLDHLEPEQKEIILKQTEVPIHLCCSDPSWLYHIYQDTIVDTSKVTFLVKSALSEATARLKQGDYLGISKLRPSKVQNVVCVLAKQLEELKTSKIQTYFLHLHWNEPWTNSLTAEQKVHYEVLIQDLQEQTKPVSSHKSTSTVLSLNIDKHGFYYVWVRCVLNDVYGGPYSDVIICEESVQ